MQYIPTYVLGLVTAVVAAVGEGIYFGFYKTEGPGKLAYGFES